MKQDEKGRLASKLTVFLVIFCLIAWFTSAQILAIPERQMEDTPKLEPVLKTLTESRVRTEVDVDWHTKQSRVTFSGTDATGTVWVPVYWGVPDFIDAQQWQTEAPSTNGEYITFDPNDWITIVDQSWIDLTVTRTELTGAGGLTSGAASELLFLWTR